MKVCKKLFLATLVSISGTSAFAQCYEAPWDNNDHWKYRYCKFNTSVYQRVVDQTPVVESRLKGAAVLNTKNGSVNFKYGKDTEYNVHEGTKIKQPSQVQAHQINVSVNWPNASQQVPCGYKARFELWAVMHRIHFRLERFNVLQGNWKNTGYVETSKLQYQNAKAVFKNMGKLGGGTRCN